MERKDSLAKEIEKMIREDEGVRSKVYKDSLGIRTVGVGFNMESPSAKGFWENAGIPEDFDEVLEGKQSLSQDSIDALLEVTLGNSKKEISNVVPNFSDLSENRQAALLNMHFQLGTSRLSGFKNMIAALESHDYERAYAEALDSKWAKQTPNRAKEVANMLLLG